MAITLYRSKYLSISLMALFTLLTLFSFHFRLSLRGQIECSVVMGLVASPSRFLPFSRFLTPSILQSQFSTWLSQTLTVSLLYLVFWFTLLQSSNRFSKSKNYVKNSDPIWSPDLINWQLRPGHPITQNIEPDPNIRSNIGPKFSNPIQLGQVWFGSKTNPARLVDNPRCSYVHASFYWDFLVFGSRHYYESVLLGELEKNWTSSKLWLGWHGLCYYDAFHDPTL